MVGKRWSTAKQPHRRVLPASHRGVRHPVRCGRDTVRAVLSTGVRWSPTFPESTTEGLERELEFANGVDGPHSTYRHRRDGAEVAHLLGKEKVVGSIPTLGSTAPDGIRPGS